MSILHTEKFNSKEQNKFLQDENTKHTKSKGKLALEIQTLESKIEHLLNCQQCHKIFRDRSSLNNHLISHHVAKKCKCSVCDKRFWTTDDMQNHIKSRDGYTTKKEDLSKN